MAKKMFQFASDCAAPSYHLPNSPFSPRRRGSGSRIPRPTLPVTTRLSESALGAPEDFDSDISDTSILGSPNGDERPLIEKAIPVRARRESTKRLPLDNQASVQAASVRLVNIGRGNSQASTAESTRDTSHGSHIPPTELSTISEKSRCSTTTSSDYHSFVQTDRPLLRVSLSADRIIMGDEAHCKSFPNLTEERRPRGIFRPQIIQHISSRNDTPSDSFSKPGEGRIEPQHGHYHNPFFPAERIDTSPHSSMECLNGDPIQHGSTLGMLRDRIEHGTSYSVPVLPPRTSSLNALSSLNSSPEKKNEAWGKISTVNSSGTTGDSDNVTFLDICQSHPEVEGNIIQTGVVITPNGRAIRSEKRIYRASAPRISRVIGGLRNAFSRTRSEKCSKSELTFDIVDNPIPTSRLAPHTPTNSENCSPKKCSKKRPFGPQILPSHGSGQFRDIETTGLDSVRQTLNGLGRLVVENDDIEQRRVWYREFIRLYGLLADYNSRDLRIGEAASLVAQMRAEASLRRYAMILQVHQISQDHDTFYAADLPSDRVVEDWANTRR